MRGFVLALQRAKNEDMIATVLSENSLGKYYRFYGARHSILQLGHLIDFEIQEDQNGRFMPRLRSLRHFGFPWLYERSRLMLWHDFIKLFEPHLRDADTLDSFYFDLLLAAARHWDRQNPRRIIIESYHALLKHEGRLHPIDRCYICESPIKEHVHLMPAFKPAHPECIYAPPLPRMLIEDFMAQGKTLYLDDTIVEQLHGVVLKGL